MPELDESAVDDNRVWKIHVTLISGKDMYWSTASTRQAIAMRDAAKNGKIWSTSNTFFNGKHVVWLNISGGGDA